MKRMLRGNGRIVEMLSRMDRVETFTDYHEALAFLRGVVADEGNAETLRYFLMDHFPDPVDEWNTIEVARRMARLLAAGSVTMVSQPWALGPVVPTMTGQEVEPSPPPPRPAASSAAEEAAEEETAEEPDEETLVAAEDQAAVFTQASNTASPVCTA
ncbi:MAG: hypothetical protein AB7E47_04180 [Desulfovibrionaceae bacterium]